MGEEEHGVEQAEARSGAVEGEQAPSAKERLDEDGIPLDREPTLDDVRGGSGVHRALAVGCTLVVVALVLGFWLLRGVLLR
ncbi:MAG: hypothetical protein IT372_02200 [Polyangiaceae bacterium]|nr:hypothetical protein [Polyangiaceae bacterium]